MRIFQDKPLVYFILLIISAHLCLNYSNPEIDTNLMPEVLILDDKTVPLYSSFILVDCKIIPDKIIFQVMDEFRRAKDITDFTQH